MVDLKNNEEWQSLKNDLFYQSETLAKYIEEINDAKLQQDFFDEKYGSYLRNIDGQVEHAYYHLGQIVLLKKMLTYSSVS